MKEKTSVVCNALIGCMLLVSSQGVFAQAENPLKDPGFEQQLPSKQGGWTLFDQSRYSSDHARSGRQSMFNWGFSRILPSPPFVLGTASGSFQEFAASPGSRWQLTGYGMTPLRPVAARPRPRLRIRSTARARSENGCCWIPASQPRRPTPPGFMPSPFMSTTPVRGSPRGSILMT